jgi:hypothetical protein
VPTSTANHVIHSMTYQIAEWLVVRRIKKALGNFESQGGEGFSLSESDWTQFSRASVRKLMVRWYLFELD